MFKYIILVGCIIILAYSYQHNINDIQTVLDPKNVCPNPTKIKAKKPRDPKDAKDRMDSLVIQQEEITYKLEEKKAKEKDKFLREEMLRQNGKPCHERAEKKQETPDDLLDKLLHGWGWY